MTKPEFVGYLVVPKNRIGITDAASGDWDAHNLYVNPVCAAELRNELNNEEKSNDKWVVRKVVLTFEEVVYDNKD